MNPAVGLRVLLVTCQDYITHVRKSSAIGSLERMEMLWTSACPGAARCHEPDLQRVRTGALFRARGSGVCFEMNFLRWHDKCIKKLALRKALDTRARHRSRPRWATGKNH